MPGEVTMEPESTVGSQDLKKDRSHAQEATDLPGTSAPESLPNGGTLRGPNGILPNGTAAADPPPLPTTNGSMEVTSTTLAGPPNPPPLDQSWRQHESYKSLGLVIERLAQKCYKDLNTTLTKMSELDTEPQQAQANGILPHSAEDVSEGSRRKKRLLMDFAKEQRDVFVKTLVLSDWSHNEMDQGRLIDVKVWQDKQREAQSNAIRSIGQTKVNMIQAKVPAPNIEGAMELLATGKAAWMPDLGYVPPQRLTGKQLLKTLRNMNVVLATRLALHEELPSHFADYTVADGRATFVVKDEFEVDLSVADEDPASNFYFIDIRLLFKPAPQVLDDRLRGPLEAKVNQELATKGLKGCYEFLHNFAITHKINILRNQAVELTRGKWFDCIRTENMRRSFIVHYWATAPGPKSWVEIGIGSGKKMAKMQRRATTPHVSVRWFRRGKEVTDEVLEFDWKDLDLEKCLNKIIGKHIDWILQDLLRRIQNVPIPDSPAIAELKDPDDQTDAPALVLKHPSLSVPLQVRIEAVTGRFSITPPSQSAAPVERQLNGSATVDAAKSLTSLVCAVASARLQKEAELVGWTRTPNLARQDNLPRVFGEAVRHISVYSPSRAWGDDWALAVTFTISGEKFWAVSLAEKRGGRGDVTGKTIATVRHISGGDSVIPGGPVAGDELLRIERLAVAEVAFGALSKQLQEMQIPFTLDTLGTSASEGEARVNNSARTTAMFIRFSSLMKSADEKLCERWAHELVRLTHHGATTDDDGQEGVRHDLRLTVDSGKASVLQKYLKQHGDRDLAMNSTGGLAIRFQTPFGQPFVEHMQKRLESVVRLDRWITVLKKQRADLTRVNLSRLEFNYNEAPQLGAQISFFRDGTLPVRLKFHPSESNPHQRIRVLLEKELNQPVEKGFEVFACILRFTLPVLRTLSRLEVLDPTKRTLVIHPRSSTWYCIKYMAPLQPCVFQLRARRRIEGAAIALRWFLAPSANQGLPEALTKALDGAWQGSGEHWRGLRNGAEAGLRGIATLLEKVDEIVRNVPISEQPAEKPDGGGVENTSAQNSTSKQSDAPAPSAKQAPAQPPRSMPAKKEPDVIMLD